MYPVLLGIDPYYLKGCPPCPLVFVWSRLFLYYQSLMVIFLGMEGYDITISMYFIFQIKLKKQYPSNTWLKIRKNMQIIQKRCKYDVEHLFYQILILNTPFPRISKMVGPTRNVHLWGVFHWRGVRAKLRCIQITDKINVINI